MRYTEYEYGVKLNTVFDVIKDIAFTLILAPIRLVREIGLKVIYLGKTAILQILCVATIFAGINTIFFVVKLIRLRYFSLLTGEFPLAFRLLAFALLLGGTIAYYLLLAVPDGITLEIAMKEVLPFGKKKSISAKSKIGKAQLSTANEMPDTANEVPSTMSEVPSMVNEVPSAPQNSAQKLKQSSGNVPTESAASTTSEKEIRQKLQQEAEDFSLEGLLARCKQKGQFGDNYGMSSEVQSKLKQQMDAVANYTSAQDDCESVIPPNFVQNEMLGEGEMLNDYLSDIHMSETLEGGFNYDFET